MPARSIFGIVGIEYQLPSLYIEQEDIANSIGVEVGKVKIGLGLEQMGVPSGREDAVSLALGAVKRLMDKHGIDPMAIGRLEVGTESNPDASKSIKSYLLDLFPGNTSICGCDTTHACYGATNALLNAVSWMESSLWDGRAAIVVASDIAMYQDMQCQPTGGAGAVAILLGPDCVYRILPSSIVHHFSNELDFMKPRERFPFPVLKGKESIENYKVAFDTCYGAARARMGEDFFNYIALHSPYSRLPEKICIANQIEPRKFLKSLDASRRNGNAYTASLYLSLVSLLNQHEGRIGERILMFSYGSGLASSMFCLERVSAGCIVFDLVERLEERRRICYAELARLIENPETGDVDDSHMSGFYLKKRVDFERHYEYVGK